MVKHAKVEMMVVCILFLVLTIVNVLDSVLIGKNITVAWLLIAFIFGWTIRILMHYKKMHNIVEKMDEAIRNHQSYDLDYCNSCAVQIEIKKILDEYR